MILVLNLRAKLHIELTLSGRDVLKMMSFLSEISCEVGQCRY